MPKDTGKKVIARNRKARHDYHSEDTWEAGLVLTGTEVKSLREGRASLRDGFDLIFQNEAWLENVYIPEYLQGTWRSEEHTSELQSRFDLVCRLLLEKKNNKQM